MHHTKGTHTFIVEWNRTICWVFERHQMRKSTDDKSRHRLSLQHFVLCLYFVLIFKNSKVHWKRSFQQPLLFSSRFFFLFFSLLMLIADIMGINDVSAYDEISRQCDYSNRCIVSTDSTFVWTITVKWKCSEKRQTIAK